MYTNAKIRIYPVGTYLLKVKNENSRTRCVICSNSTKKKHRNDIDMKTLRNIDIAVVSLLLTLKRFLFLVFHLEFREVSVTGWVYQHRSRYRQVKIMKHARTNANYAILTKRVILQHEKKPVSNLISMQSVGFEQT